MKVYFSDGTYIESLPLSAWPEAELPAIATFITRFADTRSIQFRVEDGFVVVRTDSVRCLTFTKEEIAYANEFLSKESSAT